MRSIVARQRCLIRRRCQLGKGQFNIANQVNALAQQGQGHHITLACRNGPPGASLAPDLELLAKRQRGLCAVQAPEGTASGEILDLEADLRIGTDIGLTCARFGCVDTRLSCSKARLTCNGTLDRSLERYGFGQSRRGIDQRRSHKGGAQVYGHGKLLNLTCVQRAGPKAPTLRRCKFRRKGAEAAALAPMSSGWRFHVVATRHGPVTGFRQ